MLDLLQCFAAVNREEEATEKLVNTFVSLLTRNVFFGLGLTIVLQKVAWNYIVIEVFRELLQPGDLQLSKEVHLIR